MELLQLTFTKNVRKLKQEATAVVWNTCFTEATPTSLIVTIIQKVHCILLDLLPNALSTHLHSAFFFLQAGLERPECYFFVLITLGYCPHLLTGEIIWLFSSPDSPKECRWMQNAKPVLLCLLVLAPLQSVYITSKCRYGSQETNPLWAPQQGWLP